MLEPVTASLLAQHGQIAHGFFTRKGGVSKGIYSELNCGLGSADKTAMVEINRQKVADSLISRGQLVNAYQIHSNRSLFVEASNLEDLSATDAIGPGDALVTTTRKLVIGVLTADCGPLLLADVQAGVIAAAHAGWRGTVSGIVGSCVDLMCEKGADRDRIISVLGPCIGVENYEVGEDFEAELSSQWSDGEQFLVRSKNSNSSTSGSTSKRHFDLPRAIMARLSEAGVKSVDSIATCTYSHEDQFFSARRAFHRGEIDFGRQFSAIALL